MMISHPSSQPTSHSANHSASQPPSQQPSQPATQPASQPANQPASHLHLDKRSVTILAILLETQRVATHSCLSSANHKKKRDSVDQLWVAPHPLPRWSQLFIMKNMLFQYKLIAETPPSGQSEKTGKAGKTGKTGSPRNSWRRGVEGWPRDGHPIVTDRPSYPIGRKSGFP